MPLYRTGFRWHYLSNQNEHEGYLIRIFDSLRDLKERHVPMSNLMPRDWIRSIKPRRCLRLFVVKLNGMPLGRTPFGSAMGKLQSAMT